MKRSEGGNEVTTITYTNGNITGVKVKSDDDREGVYVPSIEYTSQAYPNGIENKGCIMLFDTGFGIDMDEMDMAYYAGILGKATKNLPLKKTESYVGETNPDVYVLNWTLNTTGYPTKVSYDDGGEDVNINFAW